MSNLESKSTGFAIHHPRLIARAMIIITLVLAAGAGLPTLFPDALGFLPQVTIDTDPETMLPADDPARVLHNKNKEIFNLHDAVVLGVVNDKHPNGVFNPSTLTKVYELTEFAKDIEGVIVPDIMAPSTTDAIESDGPGSVSFDWLMPRAPTTDAEALAVRDRAMRIPFLKGTLVSEDGKALVIYVPLEDKDLAHEVSTALREKIGHLGAGDDSFHIAGIPVAEDTFGIEMFIQMGISAPAAMLVIFLLMWFFFRSLTIIMAPMYVAMASALSTMGLLVLTGNTVHIMSSMIPIFIMPIAVLDAVHIISDFFDSYQETQDRKKTLQKVMGHLFSPMLFTSLTTTAGFASLALTPIPPVQVFGVFIAIGVLLAWLFTILFVPAYIMLLSPKRLEGFGRAFREHESHGGILARLGRMRGLHARLIVVAGMGLVAVAVIGIQKITVNDNPTKWFEEGHEIRVADRVLNEHFGGTYDAYLSIRYKRAPYSPEGFKKELLDAAKREAVATRQVFLELSEIITQQETTDPDPLLDAVDTLARKRKLKDADIARRTGWAHAGDFLADQFEIADELSDQPGSGSRASAPDTAEFKEQLLTAARQRSEAIGLHYAQLEQLADRASKAAPESARAFTDALRGAVEVTPPPVATTLNAYLDRRSQSSEVFKQPKALAYLENLQAAMAAHPAVGKSNSLADIVKVVHRDLISGNEEDYRIPNTAEIVGQTLTQYQSSHRKDDLWHFVESDFEHAIIWFQLKSGDNVDMESVIAAVSDYVEAHPAPFDIEQPSWFGLTYINVVWQTKMVTGMVSALLGSFAIVLLMMTILFRSLLWGILSMVPLTLTVALIYGILGLVGKDYDMPVAVLSSLSLGLAVDYAIHFLARARELRHEHGSWRAAQPIVFQEPARAIARNVVVVGAGFLPLLLAPLVPYQTVGMLIAAILVAAGVATLVLLPALIQILEPLLFRGKGAKASVTSKPSKSN